MHSFGMIHLSILLGMRVPKYEPTKIKIVENMPNNLYFAFPVQWNVLYLYYII